MAVAGCTDALPADITEPASVSPAEHPRPCPATLAAPARPRRRLPIGCLGVSVGLLHAVLLAMSLPERSPSPLRAPRPPSCACIW